MAHWKHAATRCAVIGCDRTRVKGWSTCDHWKHYGLGRPLTMTRDAPPAIDPPDGHAYFPGGYRRPGGGS